MRATQRRVEEIQHHNRDDDHDALERDEKILARHQGARPAAAELDDAEDAPDEDANGGHHQRAQKPFEARGAAEADHVRVVVEGAGEVGEVGVAGGAVGAQGEVCGDEHEGEHGEDLEGEAGNHDGVAFCGGEVAFGGDGGEGAAYGLEGEGD